MGRAFPTISSLLCQFPLSPALSRLSYLSASNNPSTNMLANTYTTSTLPCLPIPATVPTAEGLLISTEMDALRLFEAARLYPSQFPMVANRIEDWKVRVQLFVHGSIFIFQRRPDFARWTDGRRWMPNQQIGPFLCYEEAMRRDVTQNTYRQGVNRGERGYNRPDLERKEGGLQKWTYTVHVIANPQVSQERLVWEMIWYLQPQLFATTGHGLVPVAQHDFLRTINVPPYLYFMEGNVPLPRQTSNIIRIPESGLFRSQAQVFPVMASMGATIARPMSVPPGHFGGRGPSIAPFGSREETSPLARQRFQLPPITEILGPNRTIALDHARLPSYAEFIARTQNLPDQAFGPRS
ncbi:hypothetical protein CALVIDRAFT_596687 [Calocera viscosa TUFC12733]|uniref:Uncharacterized protein n=1 Tax=Calocera viscosa (strain TUFC12733) TaxID=1330018 RepID=A0A167PA93_CALVF|nr:hypothetical protein CALVIDRAFT_596687 [Calocera viscosa TUFC12733]